ncbi:MAG TPA: orotate phosphoribosyltransferase [Edaphocola sp.]|nr:orotate phosphoribosyltransferase [Edaphocola sp.]
MNQATIFAEKLLQIKALKLNVDQPFTWTSGWKSPVYCDNRRLLSFPFVRDYVKSELANLVFDKFPDAEVIAGVATAGIPHGTLVADLLKLPFVYVRDKAKGHGLGNQIEGTFEPGQKVVVVEDLISTGKSSLAAVEALKAAGAEVIGLVALFTYEFDKASQVFEEAGVPVFTISNYGALVETGLKLGIIKEEQQELLASWRSNPSEWMQ